MLCRDAEQAVLNDCLTSKRAEFIAVYGRRRVGKTFLIHAFFKEKKDTIFMHVTGKKQGERPAQIKHFTEALGLAFYHGAKLKVQDQWEDAFADLTQAIKNTDQNKKIVLFFDEFPWMAIPKSNLLSSLDFYWNHHWSHDSRIKLIICGSSASWIINKIIKDRGGLHNRITRQMLIEPLNLKETKQFLHHQGVRLNNRQITQVYMLTGGIPYYLTHIQKGQSATEIIETLAFGKTSPLLQEFDILFASLFNNYEASMTMIRILAQKRYGMGQQELLSQMDKSMQGKQGLTKLQELVEVVYHSFCKFIFGLGA